MSDPLIVTGFNGGRSKETVENEHAQSFTRYRRELQLLKYSSGLWYSLVLEVYKDDDADSYPDSDVLLDTDTANFKVTIEKVS